MTSSKANIIKKLMEIYPYSYEWFVKQSEAKLYGMYQSSKNKPKRTSSHNPEPRRSITKIVNGRTYIRTDSGLWIEVDD